MLLEGGSWDHPMWGAGGRHYGGREAVPSREEELGPGPSCLPNPAGQGQSTRHQGLLCRGQWALSRPPCPRGPEAFARSIRISEWQGQCPFCHGPRGPASTQQLPSAGTVASDAAK